MDFILTDDSINAHGERVIAEGVKLDRFLKNPVMLYMHDTYAWDFQKPIGKWTGLRIENNALIATAEFATDDFAKDIELKVEQGVLNAVSIGFKVLEVSFDDKDMAEGQKGATITSSELFEASIVILPANENAVAIRGDNGDAKNKSYYLKHFVGSDTTKNEMVRYKSFDKLNKQKTMFTEEDKKSLEDNIKALKTELQTSKDNATRVQDSLNTIKAENVKLEEQCKGLKEQKTALETLSKNGEGKQKELNGALGKITSLEAGLKAKETELEETKASLEKTKASLEGEVEILKGCVGLEFASDALKNAFISSWKSIYKVQKSEGDVWQVFDKAKQEVVKTTIAESLKTYAVDNGFVSKQKNGFEIGNNGSSGVAQVDLSEINYESKTHSNPEIRRAFDNKWDELDKDATGKRKEGGKGLVRNSKEYILFMHKNGMIGGDGHTFIVKELEKEAK